MALSGRSRKRLLELLGAAGLKPCLLSILTLTTVFRKISTPEAYQFRLVVLSAYGDLRILKNINFKLYRCSRVESIRLNQGVLATDLGEYH